MYKGGKMGKRTKFNSDSTISVFCKVQLLDGNKKIYQFPNDLREAMIESYTNNELKKMMKGALINVPTTPYTNGKAKLTLGMIKDVFVDDKRRYWRTRGQFLTTDSWKGKLSKEQIKFILHDHSFVNKIRILFALIKWKKREKS